MKRYATIQPLEVCREGWPGVWDAIKAAITRRPRLTVTKSYEFSVYSSGPVRLFAAQIETPPSTDTKGEA